MAALLEIYESAEGMSVCVTEKGVKWSIAIVMPIIVLAIAFYIFYRSQTPRIFLYLIAVVAAFSFIRSIMAARGGTEVSLRVNNFDLISNGHAPEGCQQSVISRADITRLEFREASGGGDGPEYAKGLYVEHQNDGPWNLGTCVLPNLDKAQTEVVIEAIYQRFPDTGTLTPTKVSASDPILLNLSERS